MDSQSNGDIDIICGDLYLCYRLLLADFVSDVERKLRQLNENFLDLKGNKLTVDERNKLKKKMIDIFDFYSEARELSIQIVNKSDLINLSLKLFQIYDLFLKWK